ncbi:hypothetical protein [Acidipropionibacterium jensenii]|nr:hypothetical protein [Acidipropionibacterium jensenii]
MPTATPAAAPIKICAMIGGAAAAPAAIPRTRAPGRGCASR